MAKKKEVSTAPVISKIPMPISDTPVVIDLPDGQKLVIGKMNDGSVIEVATWRGTGRPDSRTNRLMLGMSSGQAAQAVPGTQVQTNEATSAVPAVNASNSSASGVQKIVQIIVSQLSKINLRGLSSINLSAVKKVFSSLSNKTKTIKSNMPTSAPTVKSEDVDIEEWLRKITEKSAAKKERAATNPTSSKPKNPQTKSTKKAASAPSRKK
jgi:hypothetical protein